MLTWSSAADEWSVVAAMMIFRRWHGVAWAKSETNHCSHFKVECPSWKRRMFRCSRFHVPSVVDAMLDPWTLMNDLNYQSKVTTEFSMTIWYNMMTIKWQYHQYSYIIYKGFYIFILCTRAKRARTSRIRIQEEGLFWRLFLLSFLFCFLLSSSFLVQRRNEMYISSSTWLRCPSLPRMPRGKVLSVSAKVVVIVCFMLFVFLPNLNRPTIHPLLLLAQNCSGAARSGSSMIRQYNIFTQCHMHIQATPWTTLQNVQFFSHAMFRLMFWGMDGSYMHYMAVEGVRAENVSAKELGSFALWALCGYWSGPKRINYQTEPDPDDVQDIAEAFVELLAKRSIDTLQELADELAQCDPWELVEEAANVEEQPKLARRLHAGLLELQSADISDVEEMLQSSVTTCDETKMAQLVREVEEMAPALSRVRCNAIDAGLYWWCSLELQWFETCLFGALWGLRRKETSGMVRRTPGGKMEHLQFDLVLLSRPCVSCFLQARAATEDLETYTKAYEARSIGWPNASKAQGCAANYCKKL